MEKAPKSNHRLVFMSDLLFLKRLHIVFFAVAASCGEQYGALRKNFEAANVSLT